MLSDLCQKVTKYENLYFVLINILAILMLASLRPVLAWLADIDIHRHYSLCLQYMAI
jgi:hypothetical protein